MGLIRLFKHDLLKEVRNWVDKDLISAAQAVDICRELGIDFHAPPAHTRGYWVLVSLGYLFIGAALITLISANWDQIPRAVRMGGLISLTLATHLAGLYKLARDREGQGISLVFLGCLFYGASIMLIAQIYHIGEHFPDGCLAWALGVLPMALILRSTALTFLGATLGTIWFFLEIHLGYFPWAFALILGVMAWHLAKNCPSRLLFMALVILLGTFIEYTISWAMGGWQALTFHVENLFFGAGYVLALGGLARFLTTRSRPDLKDYGILLSLWALRFFILMLFIFSFEEPWQELIRADWQFPGTTLTTALVLTAAGLWLFWAGGRQRACDLAGPALAALLYLGWVLAGILAPSPGLAIWFTVADNLALVGAGVWLIVAGIRRTVSHYFFLGVAIVLVTGLVRYMDLVGDYIGGAALFAGFAVILLATAKYWKTRQEQAS